MGVTVFTSRKGGIMGVEVSVVVIGGCYQAHPTRMSVRLFGALYLKPSVGDAYVKQHRDIVESPLI